MADRADRDKTLAADSFRTVGRRRRHRCPGNVADRPGMNKALAADSHQVLRRACRVDRSKNLAVNSPQLRCRRADRNRTLAEDSSQAVRRCRSHTRPDSVADWPDVNRELAVDSQVAAAAEHTAQPHCQPNLQVQAGSERRSIWQAREHLSGFAIAYAGNIRQHEGVAVCKNVKQLHLREYFLEHHNYMVNRWKPRW